MPPSWVDSEWGRVAVASSGFLADGYDLYVVGGVEHILTEQFSCDHSSRPDCLEASLMQAYKSSSSSAALFGAVLGQLVFGALADRLGRRVIFIATGSLIVLGSVLSACVQEFGLGPKCLLAQLVVCRGLLGFGIGGEYPLSATICSEGTAARRRGTMMALVFSHQGLGYLLSALIMVILTFSGASNEVTWRFALAFGAVVPIVSLYFRMQMHESGDYEKIKQAREKGSSGVNMKLTVRRYAWHVLGTAGNWFLFDIVFYANGLFNGDVTSIIDLGYEGLQETSLNTLTIVMIMLPGYFVGVSLINRLGRKNVQMIGYANMIVWFGICGLAYDWLRVEAPWLFLMIYGLTFFFSNFGPNLTTYVIPGEIYPSQAKATLHGVSAAAGKMGAFFGACVMPYVSGNPPTDGGIKHVMLLCALIAAMGLLLTVFFTPRYGPEDLAPQEEGETVGFVRLAFQRKTTQSEWADADGNIDLSAEKDVAAGKGDDVIAADKGQETTDVELSI
mmetsp:Transcript_116276/g.335867  ORF Transcript_116276/g.335867 Transcript_116276/m.335867 type:complete len:504 (-) Transcript_116276:345-1856(-)